MQQADIHKVRASVYQQCGRKVLIQLDRGRNKVDIQERSHSERISECFYNTGE